jgi:fermentation-respiration switch protein FrsA (DUF1100 family)
MKPWFIPGFGGEPIIGDTHLPNGEPRGIAIIAHGFKGYKDYGMFPAIAHHFAMAGFIAHRFNFSHSGMTNDIETFARPDLFEQDTWNKQVFDLEQVARAVTTHDDQIAETLRVPGERASGQLPLITLGHSRGGMSTLLWAGRRTDDASATQPAGIITLATPAKPFMFSPDEQKLMMKQGYIESPSSRTGQVLRVGKQYLEEQLADPDAHDVLKQTARIRCPLLIIHGENDPTVPASSAHELKAAAGDNAETLIIPGGDHVFNTPNPFPMEAEPSPQLAAMLDAAIAFAKRMALH